MDKSHVISALFRKYCHLMGQAKRHPERAAVFQADMVHVEATIRLFRADADLDSLTPIRPRNDTRWHKRGFGVRTTIEILKLAESSQRSYRTPVYVFFIVQYQTIHKDAFHFSASIFRLVEKDGFYDRIEFNDRFYGEGELVFKRFQDGLGYVD